jgi:polygalacturonase
MKTNFTARARGVKGAVLLTAGLLLISNSLTPAVAEPVKSTVEPVVKSTVEPVVVMLHPGVTGGEIQNALNALPASGGEVVLPPGDIFIRQPIVLRRNFQTLRGSGAATVLRLADNANCPVIILGEPVNNPKQAVTGLCVRDLFIDGNRAFQQRELWCLTGEGSEIRNNGVTIQRVTDSEVRNVTTARCRSGGLVTTRNVHGLTVNGLESYDNQFDGLACYETEDSLFKNLSLHDNPGAGISLDLAFNHNVISNAVLRANDLGVFMRSSRDNQFHNVAIQNSHHHGVFMAEALEHTGVGWQAVPMSECTYNSFTNLSADNCGGAAFRVNDTTCKNNILIGARFDGNRDGVSQAQPDLITME